MPELVIGFITLVIAENLAVNFPLFSRVVRLLLHPSKLHPTVDRQ